MSRGKRSYFERIVGEVILRVQYENPANTGKKIMFKMKKRKGMRKAKWSRRGED